MKIDNRISPIIIEYNTRSETTNYRRRSSRADTFPRIFSYLGLGNTGICENNPGQFPRIYAVYEAVATSASANNYHRRDIRAELRFRSSIFDDNIENVKTYFRAVEETRREKKKKKKKKKRWNKKGRQSRAPDQRDLTNQSGCWRQSLED